MHAEDGAGCNLKMVRCAVSCSNALHTVATCTGRDVLLQQHAARAIDVCLILCY